uniref:Uncharacterized protein n=1 Tax=Rousettus aegyptiacus TaxID=9407 RepID=A0A7J8E917_ROUAE|nr:hypothetical protein HJG63_008190 [Rousettus aegyptiacus]
MGLEKNLQPVLISFLVHYHSCQIGTTQISYCISQTRLFSYSSQFFVIPSLLQMSSTFFNYWIFPLAYKHFFSPIFKQNSPWTSYPLLPCPSHFRESFLKAFSHSNFPLLTLTRFWLSPPLKLLLSRLPNTFTLPNQ